MCVCVCVCVCVRARVYGAEGKDRQKANHERIVVNFAILVAVKDLKRFRNLNADKARSRVHERVARVIGGSPV